MVLRGDGTSDERWQIVMEAADAHGETLQREAKWFYQTGITLTRLHLANFERNEQMMRAELQKLAALSKIAPSSAPSEMLEMINNLTKIADRSAFTNSDYLAVDNEVGKIRELVCS